jgi:hypothetical protein
MILSTASDICERRRNIIDLKALDPMFPPEKRGLPEFSLCLKVAFYPYDVQMFPNSQAPHGYVTIPEESLHFYADYDPAVSLPSGVHRFDNGMQ